MDGDQDEITQGAAFVDKHRCELIMRINMVMPIADYLLDKGMIQEEAYNKIHKEKTSQDQMRDLYDCCRSGGAKVKAAFYKCLKKYQPHLVQELEEEYNVGKTSSSPTTAAPTNVTSTSQCNDETVALAPAALHVEEKTLSSIPAPTASVNSTNIGQDHGNKTTIETRPTTSLISSFNAPACASRAQMKTTEKIPTSITSMKRRPEIDIDQMLGGDLHKKHQDFMTNSNLSTLRGRGLSGSHTFLSTDPIDLNDRPEIGIDQMLGGDLHSNLSTLRGRGLSRSHNLLSTDPIDSLLNQTTRNRVMEHQSLMTSNIFHDTESHSMQSLCLPQSTPGSLPSLPKRISSFFRKGWGDFH
ncbi:uncharacterized protein LOC121572796 [Coregonus clupeaformis]|uniref:uncharacterized protein LOC121572796 n=1 Tax=Coregonus clupeaformis TaxID=59861 RepID=UPI001BE12A26|nr:uncharacterized protein LOC121572796 [Coregonus clupeaformis]